MHPQGVPLVDPSPLGRKILYAHRLPQVLLQYFVNIFAALDRQGASVSCGDSQSIGPGDVYEVTSPDYPDNYPANAECSQVPFTGPEIITCYGLREIG